MREMIKEQEVPWTTSASWRLWRLGGEGKIVSLLENVRSEWGKSVHVWKAFCTGFSKIPKSLP